MASEYTKEFDEPMTYAVTGVASPPVPTNSDRFDDEFGIDSKPTTVDLNDDPNSYPVAVMRDSDVVVLPGHEISPGTVVVPSSNLTAAAAATTGTTTERTGHSYCGCCCDMRRAVIIINMVNIAFGFFGIILFSVATSDNNIQDIDDDYYREEAEYAAAAKGIIWTITIFAMICFGLGIYGAMKFTQWMIIIAAIYHTLSVVVSLLSFNIFGAIITGFFTYPHYMLVHEIRRGTMTKEKYHIEQQSCCCV